MIHSKRDPAVIICRQASTISPGLATDRRCGSATRNADCADEPVYTQDSWTIQGLPALTGAPSMRLNARICTR